MILSTVVLWQTMILWTVVLWQAILWAVVLWQTMILWTVIPDGDHIPHIAGVAPAAYGLAARRLVRKINGFR